MYAIVRTGGFQFQMEPGTVITLPSMQAEIGDTIELGEVLLTFDNNEVKVGTPTLEGVKVTVEVLRHGRGKKVIIGKHKRRKHYHRKAGHRQDFTQVKVNEISLP